MEIGNRIVYFRKQANHTQEQLAEKIFLTRQGISNWETGKTYPDIHSLLLISHILQVSLEDLVKGDLQEMKHIVNEVDK